MALGKVIGLDASTTVAAPNIAIVPSFIENFEVQDTVEIYISSNYTSAVTAALSASTYYGINKINNQLFVLYRKNGTMLPTTTTTTITFNFAKDDSVGLLATTRTVTIGSATTADTSVAPASLASASVAQIQAALNAGIAENIWNVGDATSTIAITGTVGIKSTWPTVAAYILGFNHNAAVETGGRKSIHFSLSRGKTNSAYADKDIAFVDSQLYYCL